MEGKSSIRKKKKRNKTGTQHLCLLYDIVTWKTLITQNPNLPMFLSVWLHLGSVFASFTTESHLLSFSFTWWPILPSQFVPPFIMGSAHSQSHVPSPPFFFKCIWLSQLWHTGSLVAACKLLVVAYGLSSSLTKDQPQTPSIGTTESQPLAQEGSPINLISEGRCDSPRNWLKVLSSNILPNSLITYYAGLENRSYENPCTPRSYFTKL